MHVVQCARRNHPRRYYDADEGEDQNLAPAMGAAAGGQGQYTFGASAAADKMAFQAHAQPQPLGASPVAFNFQQ